MPGEAWHNHGNHGDDFAVNVSVLDLPLSEVLNAAAFEHGYVEDEAGEAVARSEQSARFTDDYSNSVYGAGGLTPRFVDHHRGTGIHSPMYVYRWDRTRELLERFRDHDGSPYEGITVEYTDPVTGRPVYPTMTFFGQLLRPGERTRPVMQNASQVCFPFEGSGHSIVAGKRLDWQPFDAVAVPGGEWCEHVNGSDTEDAILFTVSDEPTLKALGFYRKQGRTPEGNVVRLA